MGHTDTDTSGQMINKVILYIQYLILCQDTRDTEPNDIKLFYNEDIVCKKCLILCHDTQYEIWRQIFFRIGIGLANNSKSIILYVILCVYDENFITNHAQTKVALLTYEYLYKPRFNSLCQSTGRPMASDESCVILIRFELARWGFKKFTYGDRDKQLTQTKISTFSWRVKFN